jgi:membrane protease YdiL (CAAX protease family)
MPRAADLKTALVLSGAFALAAALTVPAMLPHLPPEARKLPLPLPAFCAILLVQGMLVYGAFAFLGLRLARRTGREPAPLLSAMWNGKRAPIAPLAVACLVGLACGMSLVACVGAIRLLAPHSLPSTLHPPSPHAALIASIAGALGEEILCRLLIASALLCWLPNTRRGIAAAIAVSALVFGALHAPAFVVLFGGIQQVPALAWLWLIGLNGLLGLAFGWVYLRSGIEAAIVAHFAADLVWHVASQLATGGTQAALAAIN